MVGSSGLEPPTSRLSGVCSNQLSYEPEEESNGGDKRNRTDDLLRAKQALYRLSYTPAQTKTRTLKLNNARELKNSKTRVTKKLHKKGGDPAAPSDTATLLRLHPSH